MMKLLTFLFSDYLYEEKKTFLGVSIAIIAVLLIMMITSGFLKIRDEIEHVRLKEREMQVQHAVDPNM